MIRLSSIIETFEADLLALYADQLLPSQIKALEAMKCCRNQFSQLMLAQCEECSDLRLLPHSCGHRNCPHCQHHESQQWLERQLQRLVPAEYFLVTFTLPKELRPLAWQHQRALYSMMIRCSWETLKTFTQNDADLKGQAGAIAVLHTHSRRLNYHPHVHMVIPAAAVDTKDKSWRTKSGYLFNHKALAKVFRAKMLEAIRLEGLVMPTPYPKKWVVDCKSVGNGEKALVYLGRYLYKGVIQENDIIACQDGKVTFRYKEAKTKKWQTRILTGVAFLRLILRHVLPKGFRRTRNFGFLHHNSKRLLAVLQYLLGFNPKTALAWVKKRPKWACKCCGGAMQIVMTCVRRNLVEDLPIPEG